MIADNLITATNSMKTSVSGLKRKLSSLRIEIEHFDAEIEKIESKFDKITTQAEIYKAKLEREMGREVRRLENELLLLKKGGAVPLDKKTTSEVDLKVASTVAIFESILRLISEGAEDFRLISEAFLFPAVIERVMSGEDDAYFLEKVPASAAVVVSVGREYLEWARTEFDTHLTDLTAWESAIGTVSDWWRNGALPLLYGSRDDNWDIDVPLSHAEMMIWKDCPSERPIMFSAVFDAFEVYRNNKDAVYESSELRQFELKQFLNLGQ